MEVIGHAIAQSFDRTFILFPVNAGAAFLLKTGTPQAVQATIKNNAGADAKAKDARCSTAV
ncbi:MAG: hypothetical protein ABSG21_12560 [Spirochaetia bacterium]|jgi:hypothetical protein